MSLYLSPHTLRTPTGQRLFDWPDQVMVSGQSWALVGANGAGKSTLLWALSGLAHSPVSWQGKPLADQSASMLARTRSVLLQRHSVMPALPLQDIIRMAAYAWQDPHASLEQAYLQVLQRWQLSHLRERAWQALSGGEQQRVMLALTDLQRRLGRAEREGFWLLDEPATALDICHQQQCYAALSAAAKAGDLVIASVHDINAPTQFASHVLVLGQSRVVYAGAYEPRAYHQALEEALSVRLLRINHPEQDREWLMPAD